MFKPLFHLGQVVATPGCLDELSKNNQSPSELLSRHVRGDWGSLCPEDTQANQDAVEQGDRLLSVYKLNDDSTVRVITEWDRSATTCLLPSEY
jgi:hypothetical protein